MRLSQLFKRIISSIILIPVTFFCVIKGNYFFNLFILILLILSLYEWHKMSFRKKYYFIGVFFLIFSFYTTFSIRNANIENGLFVFILILLISISSDLGGYIFGKTFGGYKLTKISPNKTYSGVIGGYTISLISILFFTNLDIFSHDNHNFLNKYNIIFFTLIFSSVSQIGDIIVSYFKRLSNLKDTGKLIPGHGGVLDRIDGMIFTFPFFFIFY